MRRAVAGLVSLVLLGTGGRAAARERGRIGAAAIGLALIGALAAASGAAGKQPAPAFLTGKSEGKPVDIALAYLHREREELGLARGDLRDVVVSDLVVDADTGTTHVYLRQRVKGFDVDEGVINVSVAKDGSIITLGNRFVTNLAAAVGEGGAPMGAAQGVEAAAKALGLNLKQKLKARRAEGGAAHETVFDGAGISERPITAKLAYVRDAAGALRLAWQVTIVEPGGAHFWDVSTDASTGEPLTKVDGIDHETSSYNVFPLPLEAPSFGARSVVTSPADPIASPFGWHDTDGVDGPEDTRTIGNNVHAGTDSDFFGGRPDRGSEPDGGPVLDFDFPLDLAQEPATNQPAAVTNLFYTINRMHDVLYRHGFDEDAGNFQTNNYGRGGTGGDRVIAVRAHWGTFNNAGFGTSRDGIPGQMNLGIFFRGESTLHVTSPSAVDYAVTDYAPFRPTPVAGVTGVVELVNDGTAPTGDACEQLQGFTPGNIALIKSLQPIHCSVASLVQHADDAGASAVVLVDPPSDTIFGGATPVVDISAADAAALEATLPVTATLSRTPDIDGAFDNGVIVHEYGHGVSNRLVGGPLNVRCLDNPENMGEGWSDFLALVMTAQGGSIADQTRGYGTYVGGQNPDGPGARGAPYSPDLAVNPWTYDDLWLSSTPHYTGSRWAAMLWEVYWNLVAEHGFNPDVAGDWTTGGNTLALRLVLDGMKLVTCSPGFVDARNAILLADQNLTGGENQCLIWKGFAKRGLGASANQGSSASATDGTEAFDLPTGACSPQATAAPSPVAGHAVGVGTDSKILTLSNSGLAGSPALAWTVTEAATSCASPGDVPWLTVGPAGGSVPLGGHVPLTVAFDAAGLTPGVPHTAVLCIVSNDEDSPTLAVPVSFDVDFAFAGPFGKVLGAPTLNQANAGSTVDVVFDLGGAWGTAVFAVGNPRAQEIDCTTKAPVGAATAASGSVSYSATTGRYTYGWKSAKQWSGSCRQLLLGLRDATEPKVYVRFTK